MSVYICMCELKNRLTQKQHPRRKKVGMFVFLVATNICALNTNMGPKIKYLLGNFCYVCVHCGVGKNYFQWHNIQ